MTLWACLSCFALVENEARGALCSACPCGGTVAKAWVVPLSCICIGPPAADCPQHGNALTILDKLVRQMPSNGP
jgi:hypothetical protein